MTIKVGDITQLFSGGPLMTVSQQGKDVDFFKCIWFNTEDTLQEYEFHKDLLVVMQPPMCTTASQVPTGFED